VRSGDQSLSHHFTVGNDGNSSGEYAPVSEAYSITIANGRRPLEVNLNKVNEIPMQPRIPAEIVTIARFRDQNRYRWLSLS
jgi:hypothetical protein